jgi:hypothetical protein
VTLSAREPIVEAGGLEDSVFIFWVFVVVITLSVSSSLIGSHLLK